jgi:hypothetical protein
VVVLVIIIARSRSKLSTKPNKLGRDRDGYQEAQIGVPHAGFRLTNDGFEVALKNTKSRQAFFNFKPDNYIKVTRDAIIINGKRLRPEHFASFEVGARQFGRARPEYVLGYTYGGETTWVPGVWGQQQAEEIVLALNLRLREIWRGAPQNTSQPVQEYLRNTRPRDF